MLGGGADTTEFTEKCFLVKFSKWIKKTFWATQTNSELTKKFFKNPKYKKMFFFIDLDIL
jgi:hypothetical protein